MLCSKLVGASLMVAAVALSTGCDSSSTFLPPPPDELRGASSDESSSSVNVPIPRGLESASVGARSIELILGRHEPPELDAYIAAARLQAGVAKFKLRNMSLGTQDPPGKQLELVREAEARNPLALILEPADPSDSQLAEIIQKIRENGTPVVLLNRPLEAKGSKAVAPQDAKGAPGTSTGAKPLVVITPPSFTESGRKLVAAVIRNTKNAQLDPKGGAVILISSIGDSFLPDRTAAIKNALKAQGITSVDEITFPRTIEVGRKTPDRKAQSKPQALHGLRGRRPEHRSRPPGHGRAGSRSRLRSGSLSRRRKLGRHDGGGRLRRRGRFQPDGSRS